MDEEPFFITNLSQRIGYPTPLRNLSFSNSISTPNLQTPNSELHPPSPGFSFDFQQVECILSALLLCNGCPASAISIQKNAHFEITFSKRGARLRDHSDFLSTMGQRWNPRNFTKRKAAKN